MIASPSRLAFFRRILFVSPMRFVTFFVFLRADDAIWTLPVASSVTISLIFLFLIVLIILCGYEFAVLGFTGPRLSAEHLKIVVFLVRSSFESDLALCICFLIWVCSD